MPKKKIDKPQREFTRRQLSHWQKENRLQRYTLIGGIIIILAVIILVGTGVFVSKVEPFRSTVIKVEDTNYNMSYYIDALDFFGKQNYSYYSQFMDYSTFLQYTTSSVAQAIENNQFVKESAAKLDPPVTVSEDEITKYIQDNKLSSNQATRDGVYTQLLTPKLQDYFKTYDYSASDKTIKLRAKTAEQRAVLAMFLESQKQVEEMKARLAKGESFNDLASQYSLESNSKSKNGDFGFVPRGILSTTLANKTDTVLEDTVFNPALTVNTLVQAEDKNQNKNIGYWLVKIVNDVTPTPSATPQSSVTATPEASATATPGASATPTPTTPEKHIMVMLLGSQDQAEQIKAQLDNGADFVTLAKANSQYTGAATDGGDLGKKAKGSMPSALDSVIFPEDTSKDLAIDKVSNPIADTTQTTAGGIWLAQVTGIENDKAISDNDLTTLASNDSSDWQGQVWTDNQSKATNLLTSDQMSFAISEAVARQG